MLEAIAGDATGQDLAAFRRVTLQQFDILEVNLENLVFATELQLRSYLLQSPQFLLSQGYLRRA